MDRHFRSRTGLYVDGVVVCSGWMEERKPTRRLSFLAAAIYTENAVVFHRLLRKPPQLLRVVNGCCGSGTWARSKDDAERQLVYGRGLDMASLVIH